MIFGPHNLRNPKQNQVFEFRLIFYTWFLTLWGQPFDSAAKKSICSIYQFSVSRGFLDVPWVILMACAINISWSSCCEFYKSLFLLFSGYKHISQEKPQGTNLKSIAKPILLQVTGEEML